MVQRTAQVSPGPGHRTAHTEEEHTHSNTQFNVHVCVGVKRFEVGFQRSTSGLCVCGFGQQRTSHLLENFRASKYEYLHSDAHNCMRHQNVEWKKFAEFFLGEVTRGQSSLIPGIQELVDELDFEQRSFCAQVHSTL